MDLAARKAAELRHRLDSLESELDYWRCEAAEDARLQKHNTQVEVVTKQLRVPLQTLRERVEDLTGAAVLDVVAGVEEAIVDLHRLWHVFRSKLALRYVEHFVLYLLAADELAYCCYRPAEARGAPREPPLVSFGDVAGPATQTRGQDLRPTAGLAEGDPIAAALRRLPTPLIDLPWYQLDRLADAPIIAHEVGHDVEADLELGPELERALERADVKEEHRPAWLSWRQEVFADVFATLALGPAYTSTLADFLAAPSRSIAVEHQADPHWRPHPPSSVRVLLSAATLEVKGSAGPGRIYAAQAAQLRHGWLAQYPCRGMRAFEDDVAAIANAVVAGPFARLAREDKPSATLADLICFHADSHEQADHDAGEVAGGRTLGSTDARELVAAARLAFDRDPGDAAAQPVTGPILRQIAASQTVGTRTGTSTRAPLDAREQLAESAGEWLDRHLSAAHRLQPHPGRRDPNVQAHQQ